MDSVTDAINVTRDALQSCLRALGHAHARVTSMRIVTGGRSKQTILFSAEGLAGLPRDLVMRRDATWRIIRCRLS